MAKHGHNDLVVMKSVEDCKDEIKTILSRGVEKGLINPTEMEAALSFQTWDDLQPILDHAQGLPEPEERERIAEESLKRAREEMPLYRSDFTPTELNQLKSFASEEYSLLKG